MTVTATRVLQRLWTVFGGFLLRPIVLLRLEGFLLFAVGLFFYWQQGYSWTLFWFTILLPDVTMLAYFLDSTKGAFAYNLSHAKLLPSALLLVALVLKSGLLIALATIWFIHIGFDRALGFGLKYPKGFKSTHLGVIGKGE